MEGWGLESSRQGTAGAGRDMDELGIEKEKKRYFDSVVLLPGEKEWWGLAKTGWRRSC